MPFFDEGARINRLHCFHWYNTYRQQRYDAKYPAFVLPDLLINNRQQIWSVLEINTTILSAKVHVSIDDGEIDFVLRDHITPTLFHFLLRILNDDQVIINGEIPNSGMEFPKNCPLAVDDNVVFTGHIVALISYKTIALTLGGGTLEVANIDWNLKFLRLPPEV